MISKNAELEVKLINEKSKIERIFGGSNLYSYDLKDFVFTTQMLQFIKGKEYTFVLEIKIDESNIKPGDNLLDINFIYEDIVQKEKMTINAKYNYEIKDIKFAKANEEYIRSQTYEVLEKALKLREKGEFEEGKNELKKMEEWLENNYKGDNKTYLEDIKNTAKMFENKPFERREMTYTTSLLRQKQSKRIGSNMNYSNSVQLRLQDTYKMNFSKSLGANTNKIIPKNNNTNKDNINKNNINNNDNIHNTDINIKNNNNEKQKKNCIIF